MIITIRKEEQLSQKTKFIIQIFSQNLNADIFYVFKKESNKFSEKWVHNSVQLRSSMRAIIFYYLLMMIKSPKDLRNGLIYRISSKKTKRKLTGYGLISMISSALYLRFGSSANVDHLMNFLSKFDSPKIFIIDEFLSLNCLDLKKLKPLGMVIYISSDIAHNRFGYRDHPITEKLMFQLEKNAISNFDLILACSEMERLEYLKMGAKKAIYYPNIYPTEKFEPCIKNENPSISIVLRGHWGPKAEKSLEEIFNALALSKKQITVYMIGTRPNTIPKNVKLEYFDFLPSKLDYLKLLSTTWCGINLGIHMAGTNERKYDYAEAGLVVISDALGIRGDLLPYEYSYANTYDLAAKMEQLFKIGKEQIEEMGKKNRHAALSIAENRRIKLLDCISKMKT